MKIEKFSVWWVDFWENEVFERNGDCRLRSKPAVRYGSDNVLRRERVGYGDGKHHFLWLSQEDLERRNNRKYRGYNAKLLSCSFMELEREKEMEK